MRLRFDSRMVPRGRALWILIAMIGSVSPGSALAAGNDVPSSAIGEDRPLTLSLLEDPESIYPREVLQRPDEGVNLGGVHLDLQFLYLTDYVWRGIDRSEVGSINPAEKLTRRAGAEDAPNLQFDGALHFDLGRLPHPFIGLFVNVYNDDPVSRFQEVRPYVGFDWTIKPITISAGEINYIFPEREDFNTAEVFLKVQLDDSFLFRTGKPFLSPYVYGAYDFDLYDGLYLEAGIRHDFALEDTGIVIGVLADIAYVQGNAQFSARSGRDTGFQHYDIGIVADYSLNTLFNFPRRFGEWKVEGYLFYTDGINRDLRADTQLWGGMGIRFEY